MNSIIDKTAIQNVIKQYTGVDDADEARNKLLSRGLFSKARESAEETRGQVASAVSKTVEDALASVAGLTNLTISKRTLPEDQETPELPEDQPGELFDDPAMRTFETDLYEAKTEKPTEEAQGKNAGTTVSYPRGGSGKDIDLSNYTDNFAGVYLKQHEGTQDHSSIEDNTITKAYGVKHPRGLKREDYDSDQQFAAAVALKHRDKDIREGKITEGAEGDIKALEPGPIAAKLGFKENLLFSGNSLIRRYAKLQKLHDEIMKPSKNKGRQCVHTLNAKKKYDKTYRQIVGTENEDAKFIYSSG